MVKMILAEIDRYYTLNKVYVWNIINVVNLNGLDILSLMGVTSFFSTNITLYNIMYDFAYSAVSL